MRTSKKKRCVYLGHKADSLVWLNWAAIGLESWASVLLSSNNSFGFSLASQTSSNWWFLTVCRAFVISYTDIQWEKVAQCSRYLGKILSAWWCQFGPLYSNNFFIWGAGKEKDRKDDISDQLQFFDVYKRSGVSFCRNVFSFIALFPYVSKWLHDLTTWVE